MNTSMNTSAGAKDLKDSTAPTMQRLHAKDLKFTAIEEGTTTGLICNVCGTTESAAYLGCSVPVAAGAEFKIVVCSENCQKAFVRFKGVDDWLKQETRKMKKQHRAWALKRMGR